MIEITDFVSYAPVPAATIERYRSRVSDELIDIWERYGFGSFADGFSPVIDPDQLGTDGIGYAPRVEGAESIPLLTTDLADLVCWEPEESGLSTTIVSQ